MNFLEKRIVQDGTVREGNVLKVDSFLNHQMDVSLIDEIGKEFYERFKDSEITKILTIEASGIAIAYAAARYFNLPFVFAKKSKSVNIDSEVYSASVESFTHKCTNQVIVSKKFISKGDRGLPPSPRLRWSAAPWIPASPSRWPPTSTTKSST